MTNRSPRFFESGEPEEPLAADANYLGIAAETMADHINHIGDTLISRQVSGRPFLNSGTNYLSPEGVVFHRTSYQRGAGPRLVAYNITDQHSILGLSSMRTEHERVVIHRHSQLLRSIAKQPRLLVTKDWDVFLYAPDEVRADAVFHYDEMERQGSIKFNDEAAGAFTPIELTGPVPDSDEIDERIAGVARSLWVASIAAESVVNAKASVQYKSFSAPGISPQSDPHSRQENFLTKAMDKIAVRATFKPL